MISEFVPREGLDLNGRLDRELAREWLRPLGRTTFYAFRVAVPRVRVQMRLTRGLADSRPIFIIGCGRSGTTLLGELLSRHPEVSYRYEPYNLWAAVDPITDVLQLYSRGAHHCLLDGSFVTTASRQRFQKLISAPPGMRLVEKSPINSMRLGYLNELAPGAQFIHIVRDGVDVVRSIDKLAKVTKRMAFRGRLNDWWGVGEAKWASLVTDGRNHSYYADEVQYLTTDAQRGAYEWLLSLREVDTWRTSLGSRLVELNYQDLTENSKEVLAAVTDAMGLSCPASWLENAALEVKPARHNDGETIVLPPAMCADFNRMQEQLGFRGRAVSSVLPSDHATATDVLLSEVSAMQELNHSGKISITVITSLDEARAFSEEWAKFAEEAGGSNPFVHPDWMLTWAERFVQRREQIWLLVARQDGRLVGVAPFYRRSWGLGLAHSMQLLGTGRHSDLTELPGLLVDQSQRRNVIRALTDRLCRESRTWDWTHIPLENPLWFEPDWLPKGGSIMALQGTVRASVVRSVDELTPPVMKRNVRESLRRARNRLNRTYPGRWTVERATNREGVLKAMEDLSSLHATRSRLPGKEMHPNVLRDDADSSYLLAVLSRAADRGGAGVYRLIVDGRAIAALLVLRSAESSYFLLSGMSEEAWEYSPITLLQGYAIDDARELGHRYVNLSTGPNTAKMRWSEQIWVHPEFLLVPERPLSLAKFLLYWMAAAVAAVKREWRRHKLLIGRASEERRQ
jgi:CelD/BcsL family acetyltransferase involved in cellulose biosynthesis